MLRRAAHLLELPLRIHEISGPEDARFEPGCVDVLQVGDLPEDLPFGELDARAGAAAFEYIRRATELALERSVEAVATAPLNK
jgi:4-hydroxy-L-threonine phosphate dehydrogenase PdxA